MNNQQMREVFERWVAQTEFSNDAGERSIAWIAWQACAALQAAPQQGPDFLEFESYDDKMRRCGMPTPPTSATVETATIERCAKVCEVERDSCLHMHEADRADTANELAAAIRALASQPAQPTGKQSLQVAAQPQAEGVTLPEACDSPTVKAIVRDFGHDAHLAFGAACAAIERLERSTTPALEEAAIDRMLAEHTERIATGKAEAGVSAILLVIELRALRNPAPQQEGK